MYHCHASLFSDDAAQAVVHALRQASTGQTFLIADDRPMGRLEICEHALRLPQYEHLDLPTFTGTPGTGGIGGKYCDSSLSRRELGWQPKFPTFTDFVEAERRTKAEQRAKA